MVQQRNAFTLGVCFVLLAAFTVAAQERGPKADRGYRKPTVTRGSPTNPLTGPAAGRAAERARGYITNARAQWALADADVADVTVTGESRSAHTGVIHVFLRQRVNDLEVVGADANFNVAANGSILSVGISFFPNVAAAANRTLPQIGADDAVLAAAQQIGREPTEPLEITVLDQGPERKTEFTDAGIATGAITAKLVYQPVGPEELRLAWQVDFEEQGAPHLWSMTVDAETGEVLQQEDYTSHDNWDAQTLFSGDPLLAGPSWLLGRQPRLEAGAGAASGGAVGVMGGSPDPVNDGSTYRVFALPLESPNDGERTLVTNPADALASPFGWHDTDGTPGPEFLITRGNNAHAYLDRNNSNSPDVGQDVEGGPSLTFDFPMDLTMSPLTYGPAATTNLFYWCSLIHDVFYRYGFDEPSGNFQANNYGRGGVGGDYVRCEAQDGGGVNNANFSTPAADGGTPRMQMYLWNPGGSLQPNLVTIDAPSSAAGNYQASRAAFGPAPTPAGVSGAVVVVNAGPNPTYPAALPNEGCGPFIGFPAGAVALTDRGTCPFALKVANAQAAGASAVIVGNSVAGAPVTMGGTDPTIVTPSVMVSLPDATTIKAGLPATGRVAANPAAIQRDGDLENGIIIHEYTHGLSLRLTGGPGINCLTGQEQAGEGWSDWYALAVLLNPALDDPEGPRGMGPYAVFQDSRQGGGIRPRPYSRNMEIQPFTYDSIKTAAWLNGASLSQPHGIGHGFAAVLWDLTWDLVEKHGFNPDVYGDWNTGGNNRALQYVTDGLKLQGCSPTFVRARDAIIEATEILGGEDTCTTWAAFARRGLGYSASGGAAASRNDNDEAFDTHPSCRASFQNPVSTAYGVLNQRDAGDNVPLRFSMAPGLGADVLASNSPFSRKVACDTLAVPSIDGAFITPREYPVLATPPGKSGLSFNNQGVYHYNWKTDSEWAGSCRELVLTRTDGVQHRAFFRFTE